LPGLVWASGLVFGLFSSAFHFLWRIAISGGLGVADCLPWEVTANYIRSGRRSVDEFELESLRTIVISEDLGIKAVVGKPKGKTTMEVVSYLFDASKGWTLEKAKDWFERHQRKRHGGTEHFIAVLPFKVVELRKSPRSLCGLGESR